MAALFFALARWDGNIVTFELFRCETEEIPSMSADYPSMTTAEIRSKFLNFFEERGLKLYPSSSLVPDDPSLLLANAGMNQFLPEVCPHQRHRLHRRGRPSPVVLRDAR